MKRSVKTRKRRVRRDLFAELAEGMDALADARHGKRTLRTHAVEFKSAPTSKRALGLALAIQRTLAEEEKEWKR